MVLSSRIDVRSAVRAGGPPDGENYFRNGSFERTDETELRACNGTQLRLLPGDLDACDGMYSLRVVSLSAYGHAGIPLSLESGRTYDYSYCLKMIGSSRGEKITAPVAVFTNFVFPDPGAPQGRNHAVKEGELSSDSGWLRISGSYTAPALDAGACEAWFSIYCNPFGGAGTVWLVDNVSLVRRPPSAAAEGRFRLPDLISEHMLVQKDAPIPVWGECGAGTAVTVLLEKDGNILEQAEASEQNGSFRCELPAVSEYGAGLTLRFLADGETAAVVGDVAVGELWHFSGQSNMAAAPRGDKIRSIVPDCDIPDIRYFQASDGGAGVWLTAVGSHVYRMSAIACKTMETIYRGLRGKAPVGGIQTAVGGKKMADYLGVCALSPEGGALYRSRVQPVTAVPVRGHVWYQGESDADNASFDVQLEALIGSWRAAWHSPCQPFILIQLPQSAATIPDWWGGLDPDGMPTRTSTYDYTRARFFQNAVYERMRNSGVGLIVTFDTTVGIRKQKSLQDMQAEDPLHPWNKAPIGVRAGNYALHTVYGQTDVPAFFPYPAQARRRGSCAEVRFDGVYDGLRTADGLAPRFFEVMDADGVYHAAEVTVAAPDTLHVYSDEVGRPAGVAYAYENHYADMAKPFRGLDVNLVNSAGLPASPFVCFLAEEDGGNG